MQQWKIPEKNLNKQNAYFFIMEKLISLLKYVVI